MLNTGSDSGGPALSLWPTLRAPCATHAWPAARFPSGAH